LDDLDPVGHHRLVCQKLTHRTPRAVVGATFLLVVLRRLGAVAVMVAGVCSGLSSI
jgi:hypothetical protein